MTGEGFWERGAKIVAEEENRGVLGIFVSETLGRLVLHGDAREVADLVLPLLDRLSASKKRNSAIRAHLVQMTLQFWLRFDFPDAAERVRGWFAASVDNLDEVRVAIQWLRNAYTAGLRGAGDKDPPEHRRRAIALLATAVEQAAEDLASYGDFSNLTDVPTVRAQSAMQIIDAACNQLYFSSGAFETRTSKMPLRR